MAATHESRERGFGESAATLTHLRAATARWVERERNRGRVGTGVTSLDALLTGGWPLGKVAEVVGPLSSGRTSVAISTVAEATGRGELVVWIDTADAFDPASAAAAGVDLERVLWVRPQGLAETVRAAELALELCGFAVAVLDLGGLSGARTRRGERGASLQLRLVRTVERAGAVVLVLAERAWIGTLAGVSLMLARGTVRWQGGERGAPRWLDGMVLQTRAERGGADQGSSRARSRAVLPWRERAVG
ncbi:MAG: hypothetical protein ACM3O7_10230 [Acidobacteriota bacterium]